MNDDLLSNYIEKYGRDLTRLCISLCGSHFDAQDLYQETWMKVIRKYDTYNTGKPFDKWLFAICANSFKDSRRHAWQRKQIQFKTNEEKDLFLSSIPETSDDEEKKDDYIVLHECIGKLPYKQKLVLVMTYFKDYSQKEIAQILNIPEGTVKSRLHKARVSLKEALK